MKKAAESGPKRRPEPPAPARDERERRLAQALRANLRRRKQTKAPGKG
jgi:hypothetical protein